MAGKLANYLLKVERIGKPTLSDAMRRSLHFAVDEALNQLKPRFD